MPKYSYRAADPNGEIIQGAIEALNEKEVVSSLHDLQLIPIRISSAGQSTLSNLFTTKVNPNAIIRRITSRDVMQFTQDLATLMGAGLPVDRSLSILSGACANERLRRIIGPVNKEIQGGSYVSDALADYPDIFSRFYISMIRVGESSGTLSTVLLRLGYFLNDAQKLKDDIRAALIYPTFLVLLCGVSLMIISVVVMPKFSVIFNDLGIALPLSTRLLLETGSFVLEYGLLLAMLAVLCLVIVHKYLGTDTGRTAIDRLMLKMPIIGPLIQNIETARLSRTLGTLIQSGVPILAAIKLATDTLQNRLIKEAMNVAYHQVKEGKSLSKPLSDSGYLPELAIQMITVGEESGMLDDMLIKVGRNYEKSVRTGVKRLIGLFEPTIILVMGLMIGFIVISMLTAILSINEIPF